SCPRHGCCLHASFDLLSFFLFLVFFFNYTPPTEIYTLSLHDALPICRPALDSAGVARGAPRDRPCPPPQAAYAFGTGRSPRRSADRKSTRLNSSHEWISYAVFCLKKKTNLTTRALVATSAR